MTTFRDFPIDLFEYCIVNFIDPNDTINISMVCSKWKSMLENMFVKNIYYSNFKNVQNDSFALNLYLSKFDVKKTLNMIHLPDIYSIHTLNCITYHMHIINKFSCNYVLRELLIQYCILDNMLKPDYIKSLIYSLCEVHNSMDLLNDMLDICLCTESFKVANYLLLFGASCERWLTSIPRDCNNKNEYLKIINSLKYLLSNHAICLPYFYYWIVATNEFPYKNDILNFMKEYMNDDILRLVDYL
jgi:hypothetical protein